MYVHKLIKLISIFNDKKVLWEHHETEILGWWINNNMRNDDDSDATSVVL